MKSCKSFGIENADMAVRQLCALVWSADETVSCGSRKELWVKILVFTR